MQQELTISTATIVKIILTIVIVFIFAQILDTLAILFLGIVIASALEPAILYCKKWRIPRIAAALGIYLLTFFIFALIFYFALPPVLDEFSKFSKEFPRIQQDLQQSMLFNKLPFSSEISENINNISQSSLSILRGAGGSFLNFTSQIFGGLLSFILLVVISFYLSVQENGIHRFLQSVIPLQYEKYTLDVWDRAQKKLGLWLRAMFVLMGIVGALVYLSLTIIGIKFSFLLGVLAGILELIPLVGPVLAAIPGVFLGFLVSPSVGLMVLVVYIAVQQIENHIFVPLIMQKAVGLNPIIIIIALLIGGELGGILGLLVAVPLATVIVELVEDYDRRRRLV